MGLEKVEFPQNGNKGALNKTCFDKMLLLRNIKCLLLIERAQS
jgi:hypothetical protein